MRIKLQCSISLLNIVLINMRYCRMKLRCLTILKGRQRSRLNVKAIHIFRLCKFINPRQACILICAILIYIHGNHKISHYCHVFIVKRYNKRSHIRIWILIHNILKHPFIRNHHGGCSSSYIEDGVINPCWHVIWIHIPQIIKFLKILHNLFTFWHIGEFQFTGLKFIINFFLII